MNADEFNSCRKKNKLKIVKLCMHVYILYTWLESKMMTKKFCVLVYYFYLTGNRLEQILGCVKFFEEILRGVKIPQIW